MASIPYFLVSDGRTFPLVRPLVIGRSNDCDVVLQDSELSRRHARISRAAAGVVVEDLGSTNGTYVDGRRIQARQRITPREVVRLGGSLVRLVPAHALERMSKETPTVNLGPRSRPCPPSSGVRPAVPSSDNTRPADIFDVLFRVAMKAVAEGQYQEAERVAGSHLERLAAAVRLGAAHPQHVDNGIAMGLALAEGLRSSRWANFLVTVHEATERPMSRRAVAVLCGIVDGGGCIDVDGLRRYCEGAAPFAPSEQSHELERLTRLVAANGA